MKREPNYSHKETIYRAMPPGMLALEGFTHQGRRFVTTVEVRPLLTDLLRTHRGNTLWSMAIVDAVLIDSEERWSKLIEQLASQARDNKEAMVKIVGTLATELLLIV